MKKVSRQQQKHEKLPSIQRVNLFLLGAELQGEVENLALRLFYMQNAKEDVRSDIAIMKRAAEKAETEVAKAEIEKQRQVTELFEFLCLLYLLFIS